MLLFCADESVDSLLPVISQQYGYEFYFLLKLLPAIIYSSSPTRRTLIKSAGSRLRRAGRVMAAREYRPKNSLNHHKWLSHIFYHDTGLYTCPCRQPYQPCLVGWFPVGLALISHLDSRIKWFTVPNFCFSLVSENLSEDLARLWSHLIRIVRPLQDVKMFDLPDSSESPPRTPLRP